MMLRDNGLGQVTRYGGGSSFQKEAAESGELATDRRFVEMMQNPLYQAVLQIAARDEASCRPHSDTLPA